MLRWSVTRLTLPFSFSLLLAGCGGEPQTGAIVAANQDNFRSIVVASKRPVLVEFWSYSCKPCKALEPHLVAIAEKHKELLVVKVNSDENPLLVEDLGVQLLPTMFVYQDGEIKRRKIGFDKPDELPELIAAYVTPK
jgi:thioredoxin 1